MHFIEVSSLTGENVEEPFLFATRAILLSIELGILDPEKSGTGVSYGDRLLRNVDSRLSFGSQGSGRKSGRIRVKLQSMLSQRSCC